MTIQTLARAAVQAVEPYKSARRLGSSGDIWLNANESPFDNEYVIQSNRLNRYGTCQPEALIQAYAQYAGVSTEQVLTSRGADEGIELLIRAFCEPGQDDILYCPPTYGMYRVSSATADVSSREVPLTPDWQLDLPAIAENLAGVKLCFLCSPNNPTGNLNRRKDIVALLEMTQGKSLVVVDEAYIDFCPEASTVDLLQDFPHLVILRTLSKAFALAGLRCGFTLSSPDVIEVLLKVIAPYPVPTPVAAIAQEALTTSGVQRMQQQVSTLNENKARLQQELSQSEAITVFAGEGNYLLFRCPDSESVFQACWDQGVTLRKTPAVPECLRVSIGSWEECEAALKVIRQALSAQGAVK